MPRPPSSILPSIESKSSYVREMFDRIAPRYDLMNRIMTFGLDQRWRQRLVAELELAPGARVMDLATGTGDLIFVARRYGARTVGVDLAGVMLEQAARRGAGPELLQADGSALPFATASFDAITCGFAVRNFTHLDAVLRECARILRPGGRLGLLEVDEPRSALLRSLHGIYFRGVVPVIGGWLSDREAYRYLPESTAFLPPEAEFRALLQQAGFTDVRKQQRLLGAVQSIHATRSTAAVEPA